MSVTIPISNGKMVVVDDADASRLAGLRFTAFEANGIWYATNSKVGVLHRFILSAPRGAIVDHIDHDGLNNTRRNLRLCSRAQTPGEKRAVIERLYAAWLAAPDLRLGQLLVDATVTKGVPSDGMFFMEDMRLAACAEEHAASHGRNPR